jgi:hypothetical protein
LINVDGSIFLQAPIDVHAHHPQIDTAVVPPSMACATAVATYQWFDDGTLTNQIWLISTFQHIDEQFVPKHTRIGNHRRCSTIRGEIRPTDAG